MWNDLGLSVPAVAMRRTGAGAAPVVADYYITDDATWATVMTTLAGIPDTGPKTVSIAAMGSPYTTKTVTLNRPFQVTFFGANPASKPQVDQIIFDAVDNLVWEDVDFVSTGWTTTAHPCVGYKNVIGDLAFYRCGRRGSYRGDITHDFDAVGQTTYPEYCSLLVPNAAGVYTAGTYTPGGNPDVIPQAYIGNLTPDGLDTGTYDQTVMQFAGGGSGLTASLVVSAGMIVSLTIGGVQSGYNPTGHIATWVTWNGQTRFYQYLAYGDQALTPAPTFNGALIVEDCWYEGLTNAFKSGADGTGSIRIYGNTFYKIYGDWLGFRAVGTNIPSYDIGFNFGIWPWSDGNTDAGNPHSDALQTGSAALALYRSVDIYGNVFIDGYRARGLFQGLFLSDAIAGAYQTVRMCGNIILNNTAATTYRADAGNGALFYRNTAARYETGRPARTGQAVARTSLLVQTAASGQTAPPQNAAWDNITEFLEVSGVGVDSTTDGNISMGENGATIPYANVFASPNTYPTTIAGVVAAYASISGYVGKGAINSDGYIDHVARTIDRSLEPWQVRFINQANAAAATPITSAAAMVIGHSGTRTFSVGAGSEWRVADNEGMTVNATAWSSSSASVALSLTTRKWVQVRHTSAAAGSNPTTTVLTIGSQTFNFTSITVAVASYATATTAGVAWSKVAAVFGSEPTTAQKFIIAARVRMDTGTANAIVTAGSTTTSTLGWYMPNTTSYRTALLSSGATQQIRPGSFNPTGVGFKTIIIRSDTTQADNTLGLGQTVLVDGVPQVLSGGTFTSGVTHNVQTMLAAGLGVFNLTGGAGVNFIGAIEWLWMDWGDSSYVMPDLFDPVVWTKFGADKFETDGSGPKGGGGGANRPVLFYNGTLAEWNSTVPNRSGVLTADLVRQGGTSYT